MTTMQIADRFKCQADNKKKTQGDESSSELWTLEQAEKLICDRDDGESIVLQFNT